MQHPNMDPRGSISAPKITTFQIVKEQKKGDRSIFPLFCIETFAGAKGKIGLSPFFCGVRGGRNQSPFSAWWWSQAGSNRRPPACKAGALPAELWPPRLVGLGRVELPTSPLSGVRSNQLSYRPGLLENARSDNMCERLRRLGIQR